MVRKKDVFVKKHLTPDDLEGKSVNIAIKDVRQVSVYDFKKKAKVNKFAMFFPATKKYMILNETNWDLLTEIFGSDDSEDWLGHKVVIFVEEIMVAGKPMRTLRFTDSPDKNTVDQTPDPIPGGPYENDFNPAPQETEGELRERLKSEAAEKKEADRAARVKANNGW